MFSYKIKWGFVSFWTLASFFFSCTGNYIFIIILLIIQKISFIFKRSFLLTSNEFCYYSMDAFFLSLSLFRLFALYIRLRSKNRYQVKRMRARTMNLHYKCIYSYNSIKSWFSIQISFFIFLFASESSAMIASLWVRITCKCWLNTMLMRQLKGFCYRKFHFICRIECKWMTFSHS